jgi:hypothetical protein
MSSGTPPEDPATDRPASFGTERRRAAVALAVIALAAVALVAIMLYVLGSGGGSGGPPPTVAATGPAVVATGGQSPPHSSSHPRSTPTTPTPSTSTSSVVVHRTPTCPTNAPCAVPGDVGGAVAALNAYRASHGAARVRGTVTRSAQVCAVSSGNTCPSHFFWEPVGRSGKQVIRKIAASGGKGVGFLLDKSLHEVAVGWAYIPGSHSYECAIVARS